MEKRVLQAINDWIHKISKAGEVEDDFSGSDPRLSVAAILVHIIAVDGVVTEDEKTRLRQVLKQRYDLDDFCTEKLITEATQKEDDAVDLYGFTSVLKRELDHDQRLEVVALMWEMVYADGELSEFEDNVVWRVAELIGVSARDRVTIRQRVEARAFGD